MQIKTYTDAQSFVNHLQEAQQQGQRIRLGSTPGTLEVFEAPSRTFGRDAKAQFEVDQTIVQEQQALGDRLNELVKKQIGRTSENSSFHSPANIQDTLTKGSAPSTAQLHQSLNAGLQEVLKHLDSIQRENPNRAPQALTMRLMHVAQLLASAKDGQTDEAVDRALTLLNNEVSSLRIMVAKANDPDHPVGAFCNHVKQAHALKNQPDIRTGLRSGHDVLAATQHPKDPQSFRKFMSRAAQAIAAVLDQPQIKHLAARLRQIVEPLNQSGLRSSQLRDMAVQASEMQQETMAALQGHPLQAATQRVFETLQQADFLDMENLLTTELLEAGRSLADHGQVDLAHEMLTMGRRLSAQSDPSLKDMADTVAVLRLIMPQLQTLANQAEAFAPETSASQTQHQLSAARCEADRQCVKDFVAHFSQLIEPAPLETSEYLAVQSALVRHPEWQASSEAALSTAGVSSAKAVGTQTATLTVQPSKVLSQATFEAKSKQSEPSGQAAQTAQIEASADNTVSPIPQKSAVTVSAPNRDLINAQALIQDLEQLNNVLGTPWRQEAQSLQTQLHEGLNASSQLLASGTSEPQQELAYQQTLHQHLTRVERLLQTSDSQRAAHTLVAAHAHHPDKSLADQLNQNTPDLTPDQFMQWLDGQLVNARLRLSSTHAPTTAIATNPESAQLLGVRKALEIEVQQLQQTRDDAVNLWGNNAAQAIPAVPFTELENTVQQAILGTEETRPNTLLEPTALRPVQDLLRQQVDEQLKHRLLFNEAPVNGLNDTDFAKAIGLQAELDYLASTSDEMVMLQAWAMRAAQGWESSEVGEAGTFMADALQGAVADLRTQISALREVADTDSNSSTAPISRTSLSPNGQIEEIFEDEGTNEPPPAWMVFASQAAAQALDERARTLDSVVTALRSNTVTMV